MQFGGRCEIGDDEVIASFGVFFSPTLAGQTHVFQYPLRSRSRPYEATHVSLFSTTGTGSNSSSSNSPKNPTVINPSSRLTMRCALDTFGSPNFNRTESNDQTDRSTDHTYNYMLRSEPFNPKSDYCVAYFVGNEMHLTPVSTVQQMLPAHDADSGDITIDGETISGNGGIGALRVSDQHSTTNVSPVFAGVSLADRFQRELNRQRSTVLNGDAESAKELTFFQQHSAESKAMRQRLMSSTKEPIAGLVPMTRSRETAENSLFPPEILVSGGITGGGDKTSKIIRRFASRYSIAEQVTYLILRCQVLPLSVIANHVVRPGAAPGPSTAVPVNEVVDALRPRAVYMHGVWVSRTSLDFKGMMAALREVVLLSFQQSDDATVARAQLNKLVCSALLRRGIKEILETVATLNSSEQDPAKRRWRLRYVPDTPSEYQESVASFRAQFAAEEAAQQSAWEKRSRTILSHLSYINVSRVPPRLALETTDVQSALASPSGAGSPAGSPTSRVGTGSFPSEFRDQDLAPIKQYIRAMFGECGVLIKKEAKEMLLKAREDHFPKATTEMLKAALQTSVQQFTEATWVLMSLGEPGVDKYRPYVLQAALELKVFEALALQERVDKILAERAAVAATTTEAGGPPVISVPSSVLQRVVREVADFKAGERLWHLKSGKAPHD